MAFVFVCFLLMSTTRADSRNKHRIDANLDGFSSVMA